MKKMTPFEKMVRHALIDRGMSINDLAHELRLSTPYVHSVIVEKRKAMDLKRKIVKYLGIGE